MLNLYYNSTLYPTDTHTHTHIHFKNNDLSMIYDVIDLVIITHHFRVDIIGRILQKYTHFQL